MGKSLKLPDKRVVFKKTFLKDEGNGVVAPTNTL